MFGLCLTDPFDSCDSLAMPILNHDVLLHIASFLESEQDYASLFSCSLVNRATNAAINQVLYRKVTLSPPFTLAFRLGRQDQELVGLVLTSIATVFMCIPIRTSLGSLR